MIFWLLCELERNPNRVFHERELLPFSQEFERLKEARLLRRVSAGEGSVAGGHRALILERDNNGQAAYDEEDPEEGPVALRHGDGRRWYADLEVLAAAFREQNGLGGARGALGERLYRLGAADGRAFILGLLRKGEDLAPLLAASSDRSVELTLVVCPSFVPSPAGAAECERARIRFATLSKDSPLDLSHCPAAGELEYVFLRKGDFWTIRYEGLEAQIRHVKGFPVIHHLLGRPYQEISAVALAQTIDPGSGQSGGRMLVAEEGLRVGEMTGTGPVTDRQTIEELRIRLGALQAEIAQAGAQGDHETETARREEARAIRRYLASGTRLGGQPRRGRSDHEKARTNLTHRLNLAIRRIEGEMPALAQFLRNSITTGASFTYGPDRKIPWRL